jgi:hypothetical protein
MSTATLPDPTSVPSQGDAPPPSSSSNWAENFISWVISLVIVGSILASFFASFLGIGAPTLEIVTAAKKGSTQEWTLAGRVLTPDGDPIEKATVWAIASDERGNRHTPPSVHTDAAGQFTIAPIPEALGDDPKADITNTVVVYARFQTVNSDKEPQTMSGRDTLTLNRQSRVRWVTPSTPALLLVSVIFIVSVFVGLIQVHAKHITYKKVKYYGLVCLSFLFTFTMIGYISLGLRQVNVTGRPGEVISLGFANVYHGTYVKDLEPEWLFSLTSPTTSVEAGTPVTGFGAPLWAMLLSIIGGAVFTISLLVKQVRDPVEFEDDIGFRERMEELLRHQFYILFAPLGAVVVYQLLVAAGAASEQITVALAMMGAGAVLSPVLDKALKTAEGVLR